MMRTRALVPLVTTVVLSGGLTALSTSTAAAVAQPQPVACPTALPTADAVTGLTGTGWTVETGTTPEPFTATVLGQITDGITQHVPMIIAKLDSPALQRAGGVWEGMSGSPVYAADGRLIGSVSYGLAGSSPIAGITPAANLQTLLTADPDGAPALRVRTPAATARALRAVPGVSAAQAGGDFTQLPVPISVAGVKGASASRAVARLAAVTGRSVRIAGGAASGAASATPLAGGGNIAAAVAYGTVSMAAVGTTTYTCGSSAVAFGHPFLDAGVTTYSAHSASAVFVQPDPTAAPFKVANIGGVVGTVDRDRTLGIRVREGVAPAGTRITSSMKRVENGRTTTASTTAVAADWVSTAAAMHAIAAVDGSMGSSAAQGSTALTLKVTGVRASGKPFSVTVGDRFAAYASDEPLDYQAADWVYDTVSAVSDQVAEDVKVTGVALTGTVSSARHLWLRPAAQYRLNHRWASYPAGLPVKTGGLLHTSVSFVRSGTPSVTTHRHIEVPVAAKLAHRTLELHVDGAGGSQDGSDMDLSDLFASLGGGSDGSGDAGSTTETLDEVLADLVAAPRSDQVVVTLTSSKGTVYARRVWTLDAPLEPFSRTRRVLVR